jgi:hypothetical protein
MEASGLGVRNMTQFNRALLGKWLRRYAIEMEALWRSVVEIIYDSLMGGWCYIPQDLWTERDFFFDK